jgi:5'-3' exonuclease
VSELVIVDLSHLYWSAFHATADKPVSEAFEITLAQASRLCDRSELAAIAVDAPPYFRKHIAPEYKANREAAPPMAVEQLRRVIERLARDGRVIWRSDGFEADDIISGAVAWAAGRDDIERVVVASNDKDLLQLVGPRCSVLSTRTGDTIDAAAVEAKFGVAPAQIRDLLALTGDKSDNVPGVPGVGPKKAAALLLEFGTLDNVLAALDTDPGMITPDGLRRALTENRAQLELSRMLVTLRTDASVDYEAVFAPRVAQPLSNMSVAEFENVDERDDMGDDQEEPTMTTEQETKTEAPRVEVVTPAQAATANERHDDEPSSPGNGAAPTALARVESASFELALEPTSLGAAFKLATGIFNSRLYPRYTNPEGIWAVIIRGREMGLGAMTALDAMHFFEGKVSMHAHLIIARAKAHPDCEYFQCIESTAESCTYETKNRKNPKPTRHTYTIAQAKQAGLCPEVIRTASTAGKGEKDSRGMWEKRPAEQLRKTCGVQLARIEYPEAAMGLYCPEELGGVSE